MQNSTEPARESSVTRPTDEELVALLRRVSATLSDADLDATLDADVCAAAGRLAAGRTPQQVGCGCGWTGPDDGSVCPTCKNATLLHLLPTAGRTEPTRSGAMLVQFQCEAEGTLFYYQHTRQGARTIVDRCPVCGSTKVAATGRTYSAVDEAVGLDAPEGGR